MRFILSVLFLFSISFQASADTKLDQCRAAFTLGKKLGIEEDTYEKKEKNEFVIEQKYKDMAWEWYIEDIVISVIPSSFSFVSLYFLNNYVPMNNIANGLPFAFAFQKPIESVYQGFQNLVNYLGKHYRAYRSGTKAPELGGVSLTIKAAQFQYEAMRDTLPEPYKTAIDDKFHKLVEQYIDHTVSTLSIGGPQDEGMMKNIQNSLNFINRIMSIPQELKPVHLDEEKLEELIANFSDDVKTKIREYASSIASYSRVEQEEITPPSFPEYFYTPGVTRTKNDANFEQEKVKAKAKDAPPPPKKKEKFKRPFRELLYIQGPTGTGKSYFIDRLKDVFYALENGKRVYGFPIIRISLEEVKSLEGLIGSPNSENIGQFSNALTSLSKGNRFRNALLVMEEADKFLNSDEYSTIRGFFTKELMNLGTKKVMLHDLGVDAWIADYNIVLVANAPIYDASNAFMDRMSIVKFSGFEEDKRLNIGCKYFGSNMSLFENVKVTDEHLMKVVEGVEKDQLEKPGVRTLLKTIQEFVNHLGKPTNAGKDFPFLSRLKINAQISSDPFAQFETTRQKFDAIQKELDESIAADITEHLEALSTSALFNEALRPNNKGDQTKVDNYLQNVNAMMSLPYQIRDLSPDEEQIFKNLEELLRLYPEDVRAPIQKIVDLHIMSSRSKKKGFSKNIVYLWGPAGTGKSFLAKGLAKAMNLTLIELDMKPSFVQLFGLGLFELVTKNPTELSQFTRTLLNFGKKAPEKNSVMYLNEIDKVLNSPSDEASNKKTMFLDILDPDKDRIKLRDLPVQFDVSRFLYVLVGNEKIQSNSRFSALDDRMTMIEFKGYDLEPKKEIALQYFDSLVEQIKITVGEKDRSLINELMAYSHNVKKQVSLRTPFKVIEIYINWLSKEKRVGDFDYKHTLDVLSKEKEATPHAAPPQAAN